MKKVLFIATVAFALTSCVGNATSTDVDQVDSTEVTTDSTIVIDDEIVGPGHVDAEEGGMVEGPGTSAIAQ